MTAAWGGLKPAPDNRLRRASRHLPYSFLRRTVVEPDCVTDDLRRESIAVIARRLAAHSLTVRHAGIRGRYDPAREALPSRRRINRPIGPAEVRISSGRHRRRRLARSRLRPERADARARGMKDSVPRVVADGRRGKALSAALDARRPNPRIVTIPSRDAWVHVERPACYCSQEAVQQPRGVWFLSSEEFLDMRPSPVKESRP